MSIDINLLVRDMGRAALDEVTENAGEIAEYMNQILSEEKASLEELYKGYTAGYIDEQGLERELNREQKILEAKLLTTKVMKKASAQKAINAAINTFKNTVKAIL